MFDLILILGIAGVLTHLLTLNRKEVTFHDTVIEFIGGKLWEVKK